jgi:hypothetical protein
MLHDESSLSDIAQWVESLLPPELWEQYGYLTYAQMARIPELTDYARELREADRHWHSARKTRHIKII